MKRPSASTIAWCTAIVVSVFASGYAYIDVHHASTQSYMQFLGNVLPAAAGIIAVLLKLDKVEKNTNGALSSQQTIVQETLPNVTDSVANAASTIEDLRHAVEEIRHDIDTAKHTFPVLMAALSEHNKEVYQDADQHDH